MYTEFNHLEYRAVSSLAPRIFGAIFLQVLRIELFEFLLKIHFFVVIES